MFFSSQDKNWIFTKIKPIFQNYITQNNEILKTVLILKTTQKSLLRIIWQPSQQIFKLLGVSQIIKKIILTVKINQHYQIKNRLNLIINVK